MEQISRTQTAMDTEMTPIEQAIEHGRELIRSVGGPRQAYRMLKGTKHKVALNTLLEFHRPDWLPSTRTLTKLKALRGEQQ